MDKDNQISEEQLNAFVDGELDSEETTRVFNQSAGSVELDLRVSQQRKLKALVRHAYIEAPRPIRLQDLRRLRKGFWGKAAAASILILLGTLVGFFAPKYFGQGPTVEVISVSTASRSVLSGQNYILHVVSGQPEQMFAAIEKAQQLLDAASPGQINRVEVVANEKGLNLLRADVTPFAEEILALQEKNVVFYACSRTIQRLEEKGVAVQLLPDANDKYTALDRVVMRMKDDWEYIRI